MSRTKRFIKNTIFCAIAQIVTMLCGFIVPKIMLNYYGSEVNGLVSSISQVMTYIALIEGGLSGASIFALYKPIADQDTGKISSVVVASKNMYLKAGYIGLTASILVGLCYPLIIRTNVLGYGETFFLFMIIAFTTIFDFFVLAKYRALISASQKEYIIAISSTVQVLVNCLLVFVCSMAGLNIVIVRLIALSSILLRGLIIYLYSKKQFKYVNFKAEPDYSSLNKRWDALFLQILGAVHRGSPILIATVLLTLNDVSVYSVYNMVLMGISSILSIFMNGLQASFGDVIARKELKTLGESYSQFELAYYILITLLYSITLVTIMPFIKVYIGESDINYIYPIYGLLFVVNEFLYCLKNPQGTIVISAGLYKETKYRSLAQALICVVTGTILCIFIGIPGILIGRILSNVYRDIDLLFFIPKRYSSIKTSTTFKRWIVYIGTFALVMFVSFFIDSSIINNYFQWFLYALIVGVVTLLLVTIVSFIFFRKDIICIFNRFKNIILKK